MDRTLTIKCFDSCVYHIIYPRFFVSSPLPNVKKLFKNMLLFGYENEDVIQFLDRALPELADELKPLVEAEEKRYTEEWMDTKISSFPQEWTKEHKHLEQSRRKEHNAELTLHLHQIKAQYERALKLDTLYKSCKYRI